MAVIIYPPTIDWDGMNHRPQQLLEQFARDGHEVYFCNKTQRTKSSRKFSQPFSNLTVVHDNKLFIRSVIPQLKEQRKKILLWVTCAKHHMFAEQYFPHVIVFDYVDDVPAWTPYLDRMLMRSDLVFTTSEFRKEKVENGNPLLRCELVPNGISLDEKPLPLQQLPALIDAHTWRGRYELIRTILAEQFPEIFTDADNVPAHTSELSLVIKRVNRKIELLSEINPYILTTYLRNLEQTLSAMLKPDSVYSAHKHL